MNVNKIFHRWNAYRQTARELNALDDRALADLGIIRCDIPSIARDYAAHL